MIFLIYGDDKESKTKALKDLLLENRGGSSEILRINDIDFNQEKIAELSVSSGLFVLKTIVILENILEKEENRSFILKELENLSKSLNIFIFFEKSLTKDFIKKIEKKVEKIFEFKGEKKIKKEYNVFALGDAILAKDKKNAWLKLEKIFSEGADGEAMVGALLWKIKATISSNYKSAFSKEELKSISSNLISIFHDAHLGIGDIKTGIEHMILKWCK